jgi:1-acyl-sn-glycerol-3-phosphate acyltransferase
LSDRAEVSAVQAAVRLAVLAGWCVIGALTMLVAKTLGLRCAKTFPQVFHGFVTRLCSLKVAVVGTPVTDRTTLYVSNHISYIDVFVLGGVLQGSFVAKSEVAGWPVLGKLAQLQNTLFLERRPRRAADQIDVVRKHLDAGENLIMFPEGTSTPGTYVAPFRSSLFAAADGITIQPVTIAYTDYDGESMSDAQRERYAWYLPDPQVPVPNRGFARHFFAALGLREARVKVAFHSPIVGAAAERKACAAACETSVRAGLAELLAPNRHIQAEHELTPVA